MLVYAQLAALADALTGPYATEEAHNLARLALQEATGWSRTKLLLNNREALPADCTARLEALASRLLAGEPWQYITGRAFFCGHTFIVGSGVLVPRPETELLVELAAMLANQDAKILDACTGSGCIAIATALARPDVEVHAFDISPEALAYARQNNASLAASVILAEDDLLTPSAALLHQRFDVVISNPPYVPHAEAATLAVHVRDHEPGLALFAPDDDPLLFYKALEALARQVLVPGGWLLAELHPPLAEATLALFAEFDWMNGELVADMYGRKRVLQVQRRA